MSFSAIARRLGRAPGAVALAATLPALGLLAAGCGGGASPSVASLGTTGSTTTTAAAAPTPAGGGSGGGSSGGGGHAVVRMAGGSRSTMLAFAECMRKNGEPNFPDPNGQGQISISSASGIDPGSAQFQKAQQTCRKVLPNGGTPTPAQEAQARAAILEYAACMRKNGVPNFPDPNFSGGHVSIHIGPNSGIDPGSPQFQKAQQACQKDLPGVLKGGPGPAPSTSKSGG